MAGSTISAGKIGCYYGPGSWGVFFLPLFCEYDAYPTPKLLSTKDFVVVLRIGWYGVV
jgi:hypothetical protein